ncbi:unnamed protein product [Brassicogethes aeneus]|uniref:Uncharacterized protein n=1 Tax=Brassicogethes aeneus TaxID=1431903 RepID=A0A9P0BJ18_BRAAE|nr:unnamed protein product [Brassicogethes aeneus]
MNNIQKSTEDFLKKEAYSEFDAAHPRFIKQNEEDVLKFQTENHYYCKQCKFFFAPTVLGLKTHFKGDVVKHAPYEKNCVYCEGSVYEYYLNNVRQYYHNCQNS